MAQELSYRPKTSEIPTSPGVYRFLDKTGRVLYVGKAKNLRARLTNYFGPLNSLHERTRRMVLRASDVTWTIVGSDVEALQLEFMWINEFDPPYNVQFRDDKSYPYLVITVGEEAPRMIVTRKRGISGAKYFGPYPFAWSVQQSVEILTQLFPIRTCKESDYREAMRTGRPCFASQIGKCAGPCSQRISLEDHRKQVNQLVSFLQSPDKRVLNNIRAQMLRASEQQEFELAARLRDRLVAAETFFEKSAVVLRDSADVDVFGIEHDLLAAAVQQFMIRSGRIRGVRAWTVDTELDVPMAEIVETALMHAYQKSEDLPPEIVVPESPADESLAAMLSGMANRKVTVKKPQRGEKQAILETATLNARHALMQYKLKRSSDFTARSAALEDIQDALNMAEVPLRIECFDISHLGGTNQVASMVVFEDGLPKKASYRRFNISAARDDTDAMYQVLTRRFTHLDDDSVQLDDDAPRSKFAYRPQLVLVDGGLPQVNAAKRALEESGVEGIAVAGIAKRLEELWLPGKDFPVILPRNSDALFLLQRARDEAHRFAISHQRGSRKRDIRTVLGDIPGLGPNRIASLLKHFGSVTRLRQATLEELSALSGIGPALAETILQALQPAKPTSENPGQNVKNPFEKQSRD